MSTTFGWSRSVATLPASVNILVYGLTGPFAAALTVRFGLRTVVTGALAAVATGALLVTQSTHPWHLVIAWGIIVGVGMGCMATVLASTVAAAWFVEKQGMVTGLLVAAGTAGQLVFIPTNRLLVQSFTWRAAAFVIASATICAIPLVVLFIRNKPEDKGLTALGAPAGWQTPPRPDHPIRLAFQGLRDASRSGIFWILGGSFFVCGVSTSGLVQMHWFESTGDHHIAKATASTLLVGIGVFDLMGSLASGWLCDRVDPRRLLFAYYGMRGLSLLMLNPGPRPGCYEPRTLGRADLLRPRLGGNSAADYQTSRRWSERSWAQYPYGTFGQATWIGAPSLPAWPSRIFGSPCARPIRGCAISNPSVREHGACTSQDRPHRPTWRVAPEVGCIAAVGSAWPLPVLSPSGELLLPFGLRQVERRLV